MSEPQKYRYSDYGLWPLPRLPEWDKTAYPYALIDIFDNSFIGPDTPDDAFRLYAFDKQGYVEKTFLDGKLYTLGGDIINDGEAFRLNFKSWVCRGMEWIAEDDTTGSLGVSLGLLLWANNDVLYKGGDLYLAASEPVPEPMIAFDLQSFRNGFFLGLCGMPMPISSKTPTAYSYNGVVLPGLPEWDKETYPYAFICTDTSGNSIAYFTEKKSYVDSVSNRALTPESQCSFIKSVLKDGKWGALSNQYTYYGVVPDILVWTNCDILYKDGTMYLAASDPIPVYE